MRRTACIILSALLTGCAVWPSGSYVASTDNNTHVIAADITQYIVRALPAGSFVQVIPAGKDDPLAAAMIADLEQSGVRQDARGAAVRYVVTPIDDSLLVRVTLNNEQGASRLYRLEGQRLVPNGPLMVAMP